MKMLLPGKAVLLPENDPVSSRKEPESIAEVIGNREIGTHPIFQQNSFLARIPRSNFFLDPYDEQFYRVYSLQSNKGMCPYLFAILVTAVKHAFTRSPHLPFISSFFLRTHNQVQVFRRAMLGKNDGLPLITLSGPFAPLCQGSRSLYDHLAILPEGFWTALRFPLPFSLPAQVPAEQP